MYLSSLTADGPVNSSCIGYSLDEFYSNIFFSFSLCKFVTLFFTHFQEMKQFFEHEITQLGASSISCDHTFKVSKNTVACRNVDGKFCEPVWKSFYCAKQKKEVIEWRSTKSCVFEEIKDLLETLKCCSGVQLKSIYLDECCKLRRLYQGIFVDVPVKLALLHAAQHVTSSIPKGTKLSKQISKGFG